MQKHYSRILFAYLKKTPAKLLQVGLGSGDIHAKLIDKGFNCIGISENQIQIDIEKKENPLSNLFCTSFEEFKYTDQDFDFILFQNSIQKSDAENIFSKSSHLLSVQGEILIFDEFGLGEKNAADMEKFKIEANKYGFHIKTCINLTNQEEVSKSRLIDILQNHKEKLLQEFNLEKEKIEQLIERLYQDLKAYKTRERGYFFLALQKETMQIESSEMNNKNKMETSAKNKKALILTALPLESVGGVEKIGQNIENLLKEYNWDVESKSSQDLKNDVSSSRSLQSPGIFFYLAASLQLNWKAYDLVVTNNFFGGAIYATGSTKVITLSHGLLAAVNEMKEEKPEIVEQFKQELLIEELGYQNKSKVIAVSHTVKMDLHKYFNVEAEVVHNGFDFDLFHLEDSLRGKYSIPDDSVVGLCVLRWDPLQKRPDIALEVARAFPDITWIFATDENAPKIEDKNIIVLRNIPYSEMPKVYSTANFAIQLSSYEGFSNFAVESFASYLPMVSPKVGILPEIYADTKLEDLFLEQSYDFDTVQKRAIQKVKLLVDNLSQYEEEVVLHYPSVKEKFSLTKWKQDMAKALGL